MKRESASGLLSRFAFERRYQLQIYLCRFCQHLGLPATCNRGFFKETTWQKCNSCIGGR